MRQLHPTAFSSSLIIASKLREVTSPPSQMRDDSNQFCLTKQLKVASRYAVYGQRRRVNESTKRV
jgi:hypothetical protein